MGCNRHGHPCSNDVSALAVEISSNNKNQISNPNRFEKFIEDTKVASDASRDRQPTSLVYKISILTF